MFKKIGEGGNLVQLNKSEVKSIKKNLVKSFPPLASIIEQIIPKKKVIYKIKLKIKEKSEIIVVDNEIICFSRYKRYVPTLRFFHKC